MAATNPQPDDNTASSIAIADASWDDLTQDRSRLRGLATDYPTVDGNGPTEEIAADILRIEGRASEIPDADRENDDADEEPADDADRENDDADEEPADDADSAPDQDTETSVCQAGRLQRWLAHVSAHVDEARVHIGPDGVSCRAVDPANVAMVDVHLKSRAFDQLGFEDGLMGIAVNGLRNVLSHADADTTVTLDYDPSRKNLTVSYGGHEFTIALINPDSIRREPDLPDLDLPVSGDMGGNDLDTVIQHADRVSDHVELSASQADGTSVFQAFAEGDTDTYRGRFPDDDDGFTFHDHPSDRVRSLYSLDYMKAAVKAFPNDDQPVTLRFGSEYPITLEGDLRDDDASYGGDTPYGEVAHMVAPRIQSD